MNSKSKKFSRKLLALFLAVLMAISAFVGCFSAEAATDYSKVADRTDSSLAANFLAWAETTDEQTAEALLDYADYYLNTKGVLFNVGSLLASLISSIDLGSYSSLISISVSYNSKGYAKLTVSIMSLYSLSCAVYLDSIDGIIRSVENVNTMLQNVPIISLGTVSNLNLSIQDFLADSTNYTTKGGHGSNTVSAAGYGYRNTYTAKEIIMAAANLLYANVNSSNNVLKDVLDGNMNLGDLDSAVDVYGLIGDLLGLDDGYESNLIYNVVQSLILNYTDWYTDEEVSAIKAGTQDFNFDTDLFSKLTSELMQKINVQVTYPSVNGNDTNTSSKARYNNIIAIVGDTCEQGSAAWIAACSDLSDDEGVTYDPNLKYTESGNVYLFQYGSDALEITSSDSLYTIAYNALNIAWNTVLADTLSLVHVNYDVDRGKGTNFDNAFYYWVVANGGWDTADWTNNYASSIVEAWAEDVYAEYGASSADEFLTDHVQANYEYDRTVVDDAQGNWQDIDSTKLFNKLRYSPLADKYFDMQTGPINLYFAQTGISALTDFFADEYSGYSSVVAALNDCLVAVCEMFFPDSENIGFENEDGSVTSLSVPKLNTTGDSDEVEGIVETLMVNICAMVEYVGNSIDANIFNGYYTANGVSYNGSEVNLEEDNAEEMLLPLLIACIQNITMTEPIHDEKWDACKDAEGVAIVCLEEYLSYVLPEKDYSILWEIDSDGYIDADMETAVFPMCRDALGYIIASVVPCRTADGSVFDVYTCDVDDSTTIFDILNSIIVYYASDYEYAESGLVDSSLTEATGGKAVATLLGVCDSSGNCLITANNTLWENIDVVANTLFPVLGVLQNGGSMTDGVADEEFSSEALIYEGIIEGFLDIGPNNGISGFLTMLLTICTSEPISEVSLDLVVYDYLLAPLLNAVFGARYSGQTYTYVVPYASYYSKDGNSSTSSSTPFDSFLQKEIIADYNGTASASGTATGVISILLVNIFQAFGGQVGAVEFNKGYGSTARAGVDGCWNAAMYAVCAVNYFIPSFIPQLAEHSLSTMTVEVGTETFSGHSKGGTIASQTLTLSNNSMGLNRFYIDENGIVQQEGRYYYSINTVNVWSGNPQDGGTLLTNFTNGAAGQSLAPEQSMSVSISSGTFSSASGVITYEIMYDIYQGDKSDIVKSDCIAYAFAYVESSSSWKDSVYPDDRMEDDYYRLAEDLEATSATTKTVNGYTAQTVTVRSSVYATIPNQFVLGTDELSDISLYKYRIKNTSSTSYTVDGMYSCITSGDTYHLKSGSAFSSTLTTASANNTSVAYVMCDDDGNVIDLDTLDYSLDGGSTWYRGSTSNGYYVGYSSDDIQSLYDEYGVSNVTTRTHVVLTIDEVLSNSSVYGAVYETYGSTNVYSAILFTVSATLLQNAPFTYSTSIDGLYLDFETTSWSNSSKYFTLFNWDGTSYDGGVDGTVTIVPYSSSGSQPSVSIEVCIYDSDSLTELATAISEVSDYINTYQVSDFSDYDGYSSSATYSKLIGAAISGMSTAYGAMSLDAAKAVSSTYETSASTYSTTSFYGDEAYVPLTYSVATSQNLPSSMWAGATVGSDNILYWNEECTMPIYTNVALSDSTVSNKSTATYNDETYTVGTDAAGKDVVKIDGTWYLLNDVSYEYDWNTKKFTYPIYAPTSTQATNSSGKALYLEVSFVYRDIDGNKVTSKEDWSYKLAETSTSIKYDGKTEYRSIYQQLIDNISYTEEYILAYLKTDYPMDVYTEVTLDRSGMNNVNYNVAVYEKGVKVAKVAEKMISTTTDDDGNVTGATTTYTKLQIDEAIAEYQFYAAITESTFRGYEGRALEAEITCATSATSTYTYDLFYETDAANGIVCLAGADSSSVAKYGAYDNDGVLQNTGDIVYTEESWANYIEALAAAIAYAADGNDDSSSAKVTTTYSVKKALQIAENELEEDLGDVSDTIIVSGVVGIATNGEGTEYKYLLKYGVEDPDTILGLAFYEDDEIIGYLQEDGSFELELIAGVEHTITMHYEYGLDRTFTVSANCTGAEDIEIPYICFDYNNDISISAGDANILASRYGNLTFGFDLNNDLNVSAADKNTVAAMYNVKLEYADLVIE